MEEYEFGWVSNTSAQNTPRTFKTRQMRKTQGEAWNKWMMANSWVEVGDWDCLSCGYSYATAKFLEEHAFTPWLEAQTGSQETRRKLPRTSKVITPVLETGSIKSKVGSLKLFKVRNY